MRRSSKISLGLLLWGLGAPSGPALASVANGIKIGQGRVHPSISLEMRLDSAAGYFAAPPNAGDFPLITPEWILAVRPELKSELLTASHSLTFSGMLEYLRYTGLIAEASQAASRFQGSLDLAAKANRGAELGFDLTEQLTRSDRTSNPVAGVGVLSLYNHLKLAMPWRPGDGTLEVVPSAGWQMELFEPISPLPSPTCAAGTLSCDPRALSGMNYHNFGFGLGGRWRFFPKTSLALSTAYDTRLYANTQNPGTQLLRGTLGITGLLTTKLSTVFNLGYGYDLAASNARTVIGHFELTYLMSQTLTFKGGLLRSLEPVPVYGSYRDDRGYLEGRMLMGGKLTLRARTAADYLSYYFNAGRYDLIFSLSAGVDYQVSSFVVGSLGYVLSAQRSNDPNVALNFARHEGVAKLIVSY